MDSRSQVVPSAVHRALATVVDAEAGLLGLGMPRCGACLLLPASFAEIARVRPDLTVAIGEFAGVDDWAQREELLWPRGIHVSRSSVPAMALLIAGEVVATRSGGGPAFVIERWLSSYLGPPAATLPDEPTAAERAAMEHSGQRIEHQRRVKSLRS